MQKRNVQKPETVLKENVGSLPPKTHLMTTSDLRELKNNTAIRVWLFLYNIVNSAGWLYVCGWIFYHWAIEGTFTLKYSFEETRMLVSFLLVFVSLDLVHEGLGWVGNADVSVFVRAHCKVLRRAHFYFAALWFIPEVQRHYATGITLLTWGVLDLIRYPFYALNTFRISPYFLTWARYSAFIFFYPVGFVFENWVWFLMLPHIAERELHSIPAISRYFPALRFWFFYWAIVYVAYRFITFPINFRRMLRDRRRKLYGEPIQLKPQDKTEKIQREFIQHARMGFDQKAKEEALSQKPEIIRKTSEAKD